MTAPMRGGIQNGFILQEITMKTQIRVWFKDPQYDGGKHTQIEVDCSYDELRQRLAAGEMMFAYKVRYERCADGQYFVAGRTPYDFSRDAIARMEPNLIPIADEVAA